MDTVTRDDWPDLADFVSHPFWKSWLSDLESLSGSNLLVVGPAVCGQSRFQSGFYPADVWTTVIGVGCLRYLDGMADHWMDDRCGS